jgi:hypothetical protein
MINKAPKNIPRITVPHFDSSITSYLDICLERFTKNVADVLRISITIPNTSYSLTSIVYRFVSHFEMLWSEALVTFSKHQTLAYA